MSLMMSLEALQPHVNMIEIIIQIFLFFSDFVRAIWIIVKLQNITASD